MAVARSVSSAASDAARSFRPDTGPPPPAGPVPAWAQRGFVRGFWIALPLGLAGWYAILWTILALVGGR